MKEEKIKEGTIEDEKTRIILELMGESKIIDTISEDQSKDDEYHDSGYGQRTDARIDVIRRSAGRVSELAEEIGDLWDTGTNLPNNA